MYFLTSLTNKSLQISDLLKKVTKMCFVTRHQASYIKTSLTSKGKQIKKKTHIDKTFFPSKGQQTKDCVTKSGF